MNATSTPENEPNASGETKPPADTGASRTSPERVDLTALVAAGAVTEAHLSYTVDDPDPYTSACPPWCVMRHTLESGDEDRYHCGQTYLHPLRGLPTVNPLPGDHRGDAVYTLGHARLELFHHSRHADPVVRVGHNDTSTCVEVTLDEAEALARRLLAMVEAAR